MLTVILKLNHRKKCIQLLTFLLLFSLMMSVGAACLRPQIVYASFAGTVAGYILTLFASFNTAITNPEVVTAINNTFGTMALEAADAGVIDQGIASIAANTGFDMASIFSSTAAEATQVIEAAGITGTAAVAATAGENIAAGAGACAASATGSVLPVIGGLVLPAAGAVALGVAGGFLINHIRERIAKNIFNNVPVNIDVSSFKDGYTTCIGAYLGGIYRIETNDPDVMVGYVTDGTKKAFAIKRGHAISARTVVPILRSDGSNAGSVNITAWKTESDYFSWVTGTFDGTDFGTVSNFQSKPFANHVSPDIVGDNGNQISGYNSNDGYNMQNVYPVYNYGNTVINYINPTEYNTFVQNANQNTTDGLTGEDTQGNYFDTFVNPYIQPVEQNPENPDPENPDPENPDPEQRPTVPYPDPEEYPDAIPEVNPVPDTDIAPTAIPYPELPEPTDEEITETNDKITPFDLKNKFPFCLPFDIHKALLKLKGAREAPYFVWQIPFGDAGQQTVTVDLRAWDDIASILRSLELLLFIVGLAVATRNLIGGT